MMSRQTELIHQWRHSPDKDALEFYEDEDFQCGYAVMELPRKLQTVRKLIQKPLESAVMSTEYVSYSVLSLGCGPGSDLLAVMQVFQSTCQTHCLPPLEVKVMGVDLNEWPLQEFERRKAETEMQGPIKDFSAQFYFKWNMEDFVNTIFWETDMAFDFIILSYADVKSRIDFVGRELPQLLCTGGRIFVIDNNLSAVRRLTREYEFECVGPRSPKVICLMFKEHSEESDEGV